MNVFAKVLRRSPSDLLLATEALTLLALFRICLALVPVRRIISATTNGRLASPSEQYHEPEARETAAARRVQWAVGAIARHSPVEFVCFPQTLAAYVMLRQRRVPSTIVYGVARSPSGELLAHTWLTMGERCVVGGEESEAFSPIERWR
jgi:hypothetical protein